MSLKGFRALNYLNFKTSVNVHVYIEKPMERSKTWLLQKNCCALNIPFTDFSSITHVFYCLFVCLFDKSLMTRQPSWVICVCKGYRT